MSMQAISFRTDHTYTELIKRTVAAQLHLLGFLAATAALFLLINVTNEGFSAGEQNACLAFAITAMFVFGVSAAYHFLHDGFVVSEGVAAVFENLDHAAIYLFIAGTYTPLILNSLDAVECRIGVTFVWTIAVVGIAYTLFKPKLPHWAQNRYLSTCLFVAMGWLALLRLETVIRSQSNFSLFALLLGVLSYTLGAAVYALKWPKFRNRVFASHELWHLMVLLGFASHFLMILSFYRPLF